MRHPRVITFGIDINSWNRPRKRWTSWPTKKEGKVWYLDFYFGPFFVLINNEK